MATIGQRWIGKGLNFNGSFYLSNNLAFDYRTGVGFWVKFSSTNFNTLQTLAVFGGQSIKKNTSNQLVVNYPSGAATTTNTLIAGQLYYIVVDALNIWVNGTVWANPNNSLGALCQFSKGSQIGSSSFYGTIYDLAIFRQDDWLTAAIVKYLYNNGHGVLYHKTRIKNKLDGNGLTWLDCYYMFSNNYYVSGSGFEPIITNIGIAYYLQSSGSTEFSYNERAGLIAA